VSFRLDDTRAGDQEELARSDVDWPNFKGVCHEDDCTTGRDEAAYTATRSLAWIRDHSQRARSRV
jgi:hypothetical protein